MNLKILPATLIAAAGLTLAPGHARAQSTTVVSTSVGTDLYLGFEQSGNADNLIVDIGSYTTFLDATSPFFVQFGVIPTGQAGAGTAVYNLNSDLGTYFGAWATSSGVTALKWGVIGDNDAASPAPLLFLTRDSTISSAPINPSYDNIYTYTGSVDSLGSTLGTDYSTVNSTKAAETAAAVPQGQPSNDSWSSFAPYTDAFGTGDNIEQAPGDGPISTLDLYEGIPSENGGGADKEIGAFTLGANGELLYDPVPEPSTWLSVISGALFMGFFRPRRGLRFS